MEQNYSPERYRQDELTLKEMVSTVRDYSTEIRKKWYIVLLCAAPFLGWQVYKYFTTPVTYPAVLTFMVNEDEGMSGLSAISGLLGSFGFGGASESNNDRILQLAQSTHIMRASVLTKVTIDGKEDYLGNHFIRLQRLSEEKWVKPPRAPEIWLKDFTFTKGEFEKFDLKEQTAVKRIIDFIIGAKGIPPVFQVDLDKKSGIMSLNAQCRSEELSIALLQTVFDNLSSFYIEKSVEKNKGTYEIVRGKVDSLSYVMGRTERLQAQFDDQSHGIMQNQQRLPAQRYSRDRQTQLLTYGEALKNLEMADFALKSSTPYIQAIDIPFTPLKEMRYKLSWVIALGLGIGGFFGAVVVVIRKMLSDAL